MIDVPGLQRTKAFLLRHRSQAVGAILLSMLINGGVCGLLWKIYIHRSNSLDRLESRLEEREKGISLREAAEAEKELASQKADLVLAGKTAMLDDRSQRLDALSAYLAKQQQELALGNQAVGIDAQEALLRQEATRLVERYTNTMNGVDPADQCALARAHAATKAMLDRIDSIGRQLRSGNDLIEFAHDQGPWIMSSGDCAAASSAM